MPSLLPLNEVHLNCLSQGHGVMFVSTVPLHTLPLLRLTSTILENLTTAWKGFSRCSFTETPRVRPSAFSIWKESHLCPHSLQVPTVDFCSAFSAEDSGYRCPNIHFSPFLVIRFRCQIFPHLDLSLKERLGLRLTWEGLGTYLQCPLKIVS